MRRKILIGIGVVIVGLIVVIATRPPTFHVERSTTIAAPPELAFAQVNDFHKWTAWSPWEKLDPSMQKTFEGASGSGATYAWKGNDKAGEGKMTIEQSDKNARIVIKLEFIKPFPATNTATFTFAPDGQGTKVTWSMDGNNNFMSKAFQLFMNMDKMVGGDFEKGLAGIKSVAEADAKSVPSAAPKP